PATIRTLMPWLSTGPTFVARSLRVQQEICSLNLWTLPQTTSDATFLFRQKAFMRPLRPQWIGTNGFLRETKALSNLGAKCTGIISSGPDNVPTWTIPLSPAPYGNALF